MLGNEKCYNKTFDIGCPDVLTYKQMLKIFAEESGLKRWIITVPVLTPRLSAYWLYFITSADYNTAKLLIDSVRNNAVCMENSIQNVIEKPCLNYREACRLAIQE